MPLKTIQISVCRKSHSIVSNKIVFAEFGFNTNVTEPQNKRISAISPTSWLQRHAANISIININVAIL